MIKLKDLLKEISFQKVTVKDKKGKSHTQQARIRRGTTHVLIIHWKAIEKTSFSSAQKAHTTLNFGTEADMKKMANREKLHKDRGKYIIGTEIQKLDSKYIKEGVLKEGKWGTKGKYLTMPDGELSSIPGNNDRDAIMVQIKRDTFGIYMNQGKLYAVGSYDKTFKNGNDLANWLNKEKAKYLGIDDR